MIWYKYRVTAHISEKQLADIKINKYPGESMSEFLRQAIKRELKYRVLTRERRFKGL